MTIDSRSVDSGNNPVLIVDTKAGNLFSLKAAIERLGYQTSISDHPDDKPYAAIVIPGQGRFGTVLGHLRAKGWQGYLEQAWMDSIPMLGICVGMQIFFQSSDEDEGVPGFSWFKGKAEALDFPKKPMVGWAELVSNDDASQWSEAVVYFVNSYAIKHSEYSIAKTTYGETFTAAIQSGSFTGVQFHPEKSAAAGAEIIRQALLVKSPHTEVQGEPL